MNTEFIQHYFG